MAKRLCVSYSLDQIDLSRYSDPVFKAWVTRQIATEIGVLLVDHGLVEIREKISPHYGSLEIIGEIVLHPEHPPLPAPPPPPPRRLKIKRSFRKYKKQVREVER